MNKKKIPYHLIDIADPLKEYSVFQFQEDFQKIFSEIKERQKLPILCGGTGFYIKAVLMDFHLPAVAPDKKIPCLHLTTNAASVTPNMKSHRS